MAILSYPIPSFNAIIAKYSDFNVTPSTEASTEVPLSSRAGSSAEDSSSVNESASDETTAAAVNAESGTETPAADPSESGTTTNEPVSDTFPDSASQFKVQTASEEVNVTAGLPAELVPEETTPGETTPDESTPGESTTEAAVTPSTTGPAPTTGNTPSTGNTPDNGSVPGTGDTNNISILLFLLLLSGCALAAVVTIGHKKKKSRKN